MACGKNEAACWPARAVRALQKRVECLEAKDSFKNVKDWGGEIDKHVADDVIKLHTGYHVPAPAASCAASAPSAELTLLLLSLWWSTSHQPRLRPRLQ